MEYMTTSGPQTLSSMMLLTSLMSSKEVEELIKSTQNGFAFDDEKISAIATLHKAFKEDRYKEMKKTLENKINQCNDLKCINQTVQHFPPHRCAENGETCHCFGKVTLHFSKSRL